jgi:putative transposase
VARLVPAMARKPREDVAGGLHHVFARGNRKQSIFLDDHDRTTYMRLLQCEIERRRWRCLAYCLMGNHLHLILLTPEANLSAGMQRLHGDYATAFNERHDHVGHLFQGRFGSKRITSDAQLCVTLAYLALNPVDAGFCERPESWPWSSHAEVIGDRTPPPWLDTGELFRLLSADSNNPLRTYRALVS